MSYLQLGQVGADRLFKMFVKLRHLVAVTCSQSGDFTIFQVGITGRDSALEIKHGYKQQFNFAQVTLLSIQACKSRPKDSKIPGQVLAILSKGMIQKSHSTVNG